MNAEEIEALVKRFERADLPKSEWNHRAHIIAGLHHVLHMDDAAAIARLKDEIERLGAFNGLTLVYNVTITEAWVRLLRAFVQDHPGRTIDQLAAGVIISPMSERVFLHRFYSESRLYEAGHAEFVEPDKAPLSWRG